MEYHSLTEIKKRKINKEGGLTDIHFRLMAAVWGIGYVSCTLQIPPMGPDEQEIEVNVNGSQTVSPMQYG